MVTARASGLDSITGRKNVVRGRGTSAYAVDGVTPSTVVKPGTYEGVAGVLRYASAERLAVIPRGGGTMMGGANRPERHDVCLDLTRLNAVIEHEPADLTVTCQAGITLAHLAKHVGATGQTVPFDPELPDSATVGGAIAAGAYGPARLTYGTPRDFTIGMRVVTADGKITRAGGKVVKNVAGYDLCKLYTGSFGTLGVIVEATFKVAPLPHATERVLAGFQSAADACAVAASVYRHGLAVRGMTLRNQSAAAESTSSPPYLLLFDVAGGPGAVRRTAAEIPGLVAAGDGGMHVGPPGEIHTALPRHGVSVRATVRPTDLPSLIAAVETIDPRAGLTGYPTLGVLRVESRDGTASFVGRSREAVRRLGGTLVVEWCPPDVKREIDVFGDVPPSFPLMRAVKQQFDPQGTLSPGRFVGRL